MNKATQEIRDAIASNNTENIKAKIQELKNVLSEISTQAYQSASASSPQADGSRSSRIWLCRRRGNRKRSWPTGSGAEPTGSAAGPNPSP